MAFLGTVGEIEVMKYDKKSYGFEWRILNFSSLYGANNDYFLSPRIKTVDTECFLSIHPNNCFFDTWIGIGVSSSSVKKPSEMWFGIKDANGIIEDKCHCENFFANSCFLRFEKFLNRVNLQSSKFRLLPSDILTVTFQMRRNDPLSAERRFLFPETQTNETSVTVFGGKRAVTFNTEEIKLISQETQTEEISNTAKRRKVFAHLDITEIKLISRETQTEEISITAEREKVSADLDVTGIATIRKHLEDLLLTGDDHDVVFKVTDQEFNAHKCMLRARSPVFAAMVKHGMKESQDGSINIEDCDPNVFGEFLKYVYTGRVEDLSASKAMGLYYAADKYDFSGLKEICVEFLKSSLSKTVLCDVITLAKTHLERDLLESAVNFFSENTAEILTTPEWLRFAKNDVVAANELYIKAFKTSEKKVK